MKEIAVFASLQAFLGPAEESKSDARYRRRRWYAINGAALVIITLISGYGDPESWLSRSWPLRPSSVAAATLAQPASTLAERQPEAVERTEPTAASAPAAAETPASPLPDRTAATAAWLERAKLRPPLLRAFLQSMPKGGDLHIHLSGAVYAENLIAWAVEEGLCIDSGYALRQCPEPTVAPADVRPVANVVSTDGGFGRVVDAWSLRNHTPAEGSGHDQFFDAFPKISAVTSRRTPDMLAAVAQDAAAQNVGYLEIMLTVDDPAPPPLDVAIATGDLQGSLAAAADRLTIANLRRCGSGLARTPDRASQAARRLPG